MGKYSPPLFIATKEITSNNAHTPAHGHSHTVHMVTQVLNLLNMTHLHVSISITLNELMHSHTLM